MQRRLIIVLIVLAVILLLSPGIVGRLAEQSLDENLSWVEKENTDIVIQAESFERGWFFSEGRHRIAQRDNAGTDPNGGSPALIIDSRFDHGLVPITSMGRDQGSLQPGLASAVSTLRYDMGSGTVVDLPGKIYSYIGLTGDSRFRYLTARGRDAADDFQVNWSGADLTVITSARRQRFSIDGTIQPIVAVSDAVNTTSGEVTVNVEQDRSRYTFGVGTLKLNVDYLQVRIPGRLDTGFGELGLDVDTELDGNRVSGSASLVLRDLILPTEGNTDVNVDIVVRNLDADAIDRIVAALRKPGGWDGPTAAAKLGAIYPSIEQELQALVTGGGRIEVTDLSVSLPLRDYRSSLAVEWPESAAGGPISWPSLLLKTKAKLNVNVSASFFDFLEDIQELDVLLAMGIIRRSGDRYEVEAALAGGRLTVNGAPLPIPLEMPW